MQHKAYLLFILTLFFITSQTPPLSSATYIRRKLSFSFSSKSSNSTTNTAAAQIFCDSTEDCPAHSVCYQNNCICDFGYTFQQKVLCIRLPCSTDLDCQGTFLHSKCQEKSHCICSEDANLDPFNQECYEKMNHVVLWFGFLTILGIIIFLPAGKLVARHRAIQRENRALEAEQMAAQGPLGTLSFGNAGVLNYDDAYLRYYHTVNNSHSSNVLIVQSNLFPPPPSSSSFFASDAGDAGKQQQAAEVQNDGQRRIHRAGISGGGFRGRGNGNGGNSVIAELKAENVEEDLVVKELVNNEGRKKMVYFRSMSEQ